MHDRSHWKRQALLSFALLLLSAGVSVPAAAGTIRLQDGVSPQPSYAGTRDTWISDESWERKRDYGSAETLRVGGKRHILLRFDLAPLPEGSRIHRAVLRLANAGFPRRRADGTFASTLEASALTRGWKDDANWREHTRTDYEKVDAGDWETPGGDRDSRTDYGREEPGMISRDTLQAGPWGHLHELDVTEVVRRWHHGTLPNHGLLLEGSAAALLASSEWPVLEHRPQLIVDCGAGPSGIPPLESVLAAGGEIALDPVADTPDGGRPGGEYRQVRLWPARVGDAGGACTYIKENTSRFPGTWGWLDHCRVGGAAGDFSRTLLCFDLGSIPKGASIREARLVCSLVPHSARQVRAYRYGAFLLRLPEAPGWSASEATAELRLDGTRWPEGGVRGASGKRPVALAEVIQKEIVRSGRKERVDSEIRFDVTGAVRAWVAGAVRNCGLVLDNRIEGGAYDIYSSRAPRPELRPRLEIVLSPAIPAPEPPAAIEPEPPAGDYWVEPMKKVHARFEGRSGTLAQYGDSITVTMAFLVPHARGETIEPRNVTPAVQRELDIVEEHADRGLWIRWKGGEWGNTGSMMSDWLLDNIDSWQRKMQPEAAVVMFGTNDIGRIRPPEYTENMAASLRRMMADGTVPLLTSIPPANRDGHREYRLAALSIARGLRVPLIDFHEEVLRRRPEDWNGRLEKFSEYRDKVYEVPTLIAADGTHPSNPGEWRNDFSEEALRHNGFNLRNYLTLRAYAEVIEKVFRSGAKE